MDRQPPRAKGEEGEIQFGRDMMGSGKFATPIDGGINEDIEPEDRERLKTEHGDGVSHEQKYRDVDKFSNEDLTGLTTKQIKQEAMEAHEEIVSNEAISNEEQTHEGQENQRLRSLDYKNRKDIPDYLNAKTKSGEYNPTSKEDSPPKLDKTGQKAVADWDETEVEQLARIRDDKAKMKADWDKDYPPRGHRKGYKEKRPKGGKSIKDIQQEI